MDGTPRDRARILDLGGQATCDWAWHCATEAVKREGMLSLFRGWSGLYARIAPAAVGITMLWEQLRRLTAQVA